MRRKLRALRYAARRGASAIARTPVTSIAIVCAVAASLIAIGLLRLANHNLERSAQAATSGPALIVYLHAGVDEVRAGAINDALESLEGTSSVDIVGADEAKARLELALAGDGAAVADLDSSFFPTTIEVGLHVGVRDAAALHPFVSRLESIEGVESVDVLGDAVERRTLLVGSLRTAVRVLSLFLTGCAVFVVIVLVRSSGGGNSCERELYLRLGATSAFAAASDLVAGTTRGLVGGLVAAAVLYGFFATVGPSASAALSESLGESRLVFLPALEVVALPFVGAALGAIGAAIADRGTTGA